MSACTQPPPSATPLCFPSLRPSDHCRLFQAPARARLPLPSSSVDPHYEWIQVDIVRPPLLPLLPPSLPPDEGAERGDSIAENGPARLMMAPSSPPVLRRRMDILPPRERSEHGNGVEPREGSYGMEEAKESLRRKAYSLACLLPRLPSSFPSDSLCLPSLTPSLTRSVSCFRAFQDAHTRSRSRSRCGRSFVTTPRSQRMGKGCQKLS